MRHLFSNVSAWILALSASCIVLTIALVAFMLLGQYEGARSKIRSMPEYPISEGTHFFAAGKNASATLSGALAYLYDDADSVRLAHAIIDSYIANIFGDEISLKFLLTAFDGAPFAFLFRPEEGKPQWGFVIADTADEAAFIQTLHRAFDSQFSPVILRTRTLPSGAVVHDAVATDVAVLNDTEEWHGFTIVRSTHHYSGFSFFTAMGDGMTAVSNSRDILLFMLRSGAPHGENTLLLHRDAFDAFSAIFPGSDALRFTRGIFAGEEDVLSLSSFRCIP